MGKGGTGKGNQIRGLLGEFGIIIPKGIANVYKRIPEILEDGENGLPGNMRQLIGRLTDCLKELDKQVVALEKEIKQWHGGNEPSRELAEVGGIGPLTASALAATVGDAKNFNRGSQMAAWIGLVPKQHSTGGKTVLLGISKRGDTYLRTLLIHGARAVIRHAEHKPGYADSWLGKLIARRGKNVAAVALANKNARIAWALFSKQSKFRPGYAAVQPTAA